MLKSWSVHGFILSLMWFDSLESWMSLQLMNGYWCLKSIGQDVDWIGVCSNKEFRMASDFRIFFDALYSTNRINWFDFAFLNKNWKGNAQNSLFITDHSIILVLKSLAWKKDSTSIKGHWKPVVCSVSCWYCSTILTVILHFCSVFDPFALLPIQSRLQRKSDK